MSGHAATTADRAAFRALERAASSQADDAQRYWDALEAIRDTPYGRFATKGDYAAFIRDLAESAIRPPLPPQ